MSNHGVSTRFSNLTNEQVNQLFSSTSWNSPSMDAKAMTEACQELENRLAEQDGIAARTVFAENMNGTTFGYQSGSCIFVNSNTFDGVFRTTSTDASGKTSTGELPVRAPGWSTYDTIAHEHQHGIQLDQGRDQTVSYVDPMTDYDLYRIQQCEREAYQVAEARTLAAIEAVQKANGVVDPATQDYLDSIARDSYFEALARAAEHYQDPNIQQALDKVTADYEKGVRDGYQNATEQRIAQLLDAQLQQAQATTQTTSQSPQAPSATHAQPEAQGNGQQTADQTGGKSMDTDEHEESGIQGQTSSISGWEADLEQLDADANPAEEAQEDGMDGGQAQDQDYDDGMGM